MKRVVPIIQQSLAIQSFKEGFMAGPFFRYPPGPARLAGWVFMDCQGYFFRQPVQSEVEIVRNNIALEKPQFTDDVDHRSHVVHHIVMGVLINLAIPLGGWLQATRGLLPGAHLSR